jgi:SAM-dependent methyltransferase
MTMSGRLTGEFREILRIVAMTGYAHRISPTVHDGSVDGQQRWARVLDLAVAAIGPGPGTVRVDGHDYVALFAGRLTKALRGAGADVTVVQDGPADLLVWLRGRPSARELAERPSASARELAERPSASAGAGPAPDADIAVDLRDPNWPVIRHVSPALMAHDVWYAAETVAFFAVRAETWDTQFGDDMPAYQWAVDVLAIRPGAVAVDVGCGTGRALPALRAAVGPAGAVVGIDLTEQMLRAASGLGRDRDAALVLADARSLPVRDGVAAVVFAAGLVHHLPDADAGLTELARITAPGGQLALFSPSGRAALAARHGRALRPTELFAEPVLRAALGRTGWIPLLYDDVADHFFVQARRSTVD